MNNTLHLLLLEDTEDDAILLLRELKRGGYDVVYKRVETADAMRAALKEKKWDVIISDYSMPYFDAPSALKILHEVGVDLPFIISSGTIGEESAVAALRAGAHDFLAKDNLTRLIPAIERERREAQMRLERRQANEELVALYNATSVLFTSDNLEHLAQEIARAVVKEFRQADCGLFLVDKDHTRIVRIARAGNYQVDVEAVLFVDGLGLVPEAVRTGEMVYSPELATDSHYIADHNSTRSELVVPLKTSAGVIGVLDLQSPSLDAFSQQDQRILNAFTERAAAAIETRKLYEEINGHANELEQRVTARTIELHRAKEHVEAILNNSSDAIILTRADGSIRQINPAFYTLFGYSEDDVLGHSLLTLVTPDDLDDFKQAIQRINDTNQSERIELMGQRKDKSHFTFEIAMSPFTEGEPSLICSLRDISHRKQLEHELREALAKEKEVGELKSRFSSMISHEFRTPLATIQSSSDLLERYSDRMTDEQKKEHLYNIQTQVQTLTTMLEDILTISRSEKLELEFNPKWIDLVALCEDVIDNMRMIGQKDIIHFSVKGVTTHAYLDPKLMRQVIINLVSNAIKYSPPGSQIWIELMRDHEEICLSVRDEGIGIPEEDKKYLFEIYHRADNVKTVAGTGLGLAIVKQAVERHEGRIEVESNLGVGTTFSLYLPVVSLPDNPSKDMAGQERK